MKTHVLLLNFPSLPLAWNFFPPNPPPHSNIQSLSMLSLDWRDNLRPTTTVTVLVPVKGLAAAAARRFIRAAVQSECDSQHRGCCISVWYAVCACACVLSPHSSPRSKPLGLWAPVRVLVEQQKVKFVGENYGVQHKRMRAEQGRGTEGPTKRREKRKRVRETVW